MEELKLISIADFCKHYQLHSDFIYLLEENKLIELITLEENGEEKYISHHQINPIEKLHRLHLDLDINIAGLDVINNLLKQISELKDENQQLRNRLSVFE